MSLIFFPGAVRHVSLVCYINMQPETVIPPGECKVKIKKSDNDNFSAL